MTWQELDDRLCLVNRDSHIPEHDATYHLICLIYLPQNYNTICSFVLPEYLLNRLNAYLLHIWAHGRRFTKSALCILLLSTFRVSSINYTFVCGLPRLSIHTRSSANAEGPRAQCHLKSCKMLHICSTDCTF